MPVLSLSSHAYRQRRRSHSDCAACRSCNAGRSPSPNGRRDVRSRRVRALGRRRKPAAGGRQPDPDDCCVAEALARREAAGRTKAIMPMEPARRLSSRESDSTPSRRSCRLEPSQCRRKSRPAGRREIAKAVMSEVLGRAKRVVCPCSPSIRRQREQGVRSCQCSARRPGDLWSLGIAACWGTPVLPTRAAVCGWMPSSSSSSSSSSLTSRSSLSSELVCARVIPSRVVGIGVGGGRSARLLCRRTGSIAAS
jgi:hypothetical protein